MANPAPVIGEWFRRTGGDSFEVVAIDADDRTIEIQYFDGTIEELELEEWPAVNDYLIMLGTDHMEPSLHTSVAISHANGHLPETQVIHSTIPAYIQSISGQILNPANPLPQFAANFGHAVNIICSPMCFLRVPGSSSATITAKPCSRSGRNRSASLLRT